MEIEKAIEELKKLKHYGEILKSADNFFIKMNGMETELSLVLVVFSLIEVVDKTIETLEQQKNSGWIPCKERLPQLRQYENGEPIEYIIMLEGASVSTTGVITESEIWCDANWYRGESIPFETNVVAWMDMPGAYKEDMK